MYCPIPRIEYQELQGELFCRRYYLRHLCDTIKFPHWRIDEPLETLREILDAWQTEVNKKPSQNMTLESAYKILGLEPLEEFDMILVSHEQSVVRRAYLKLVTKYHPDKNPDGQVL
ncbi:DnaJ subfamily C member 13 [Thelohanellus kitauei]|uniref:DnaJ subfamily C member 13 n=1 Tax=Thelohanellus kitauei TaxID=669202 RepID=A0A0C2MB67_THEKT|nr:DnaJ subfamily C member 13 [Thelohanellus kitauei]